MDFLQSLLGLGQHIPDWLAAITAVVTAATAVTAITPSRADDAAINMLLKVLNFLSGNFGKNKNADDV